MSGVIQVPQPARSPQERITCANASLKLTRKCGLKARRTVRGQSEASSRGKTARGSGEAHGTSPCRTGQGKIPCRYAWRTSAGLSDRLTATTSWPGRGSGKRLAGPFGSTGGYGTKAGVRYRPAMLNPKLKGLSCFACETPHDPRLLQTVCNKCGMPLRVDSSLERAAFDGPFSLWRYHAVLPLRPEQAVSL